MGIKKRIIGAVVSATDRAINGLYKAISGDEEKPLTPRARAQMEEWFGKTLPNLRRQGIDTSWGNPHG